MRDRPLLRCYNLISDQTPLQLNALPVPPHMVACALQLICQGCFYNAIPFGFSPTVLHWWVWGKTQDTVDMLQHCESSLSELEVWRVFLHHFPAQLSAIDPITAPTSNLRAFLGPLRAFLGPLRAILMCRRSHNNRTSVKTAEY